MLEIYATAQVGSQRYLADEPHLNRLSQALAQFSREVVLIRAQLGLVREIPVPAELDFPTLPNKAVASRQFEYVSIHRSRFRHILQAEIEIDRLQIQFGPVWQRTDQ